MGDFLKRLMPFIFGAAALLVLFLIFQPRERPPQVSDTGRPISAWGAIEKWLTALENKDLAAMQDVSEGGAVAQSEIVLKSLRDAEQKAGAQFGMSKSFGMGTPGAYKVLLHSKDMKIQLMSLTLIAASGENGYKVTRVTVD